MNFKYVTKNEWKETRKALVELIQDEDEDEESFKALFGFKIKFKY